MEVKNDTIKKKTNNLKEEIKKYNTRKKDKK